MEDRDATSLCLSACRRQRIEQRDVPRFDRLDSTAQSLADLRGRTFAFSDPLSNSGHLAPQWLLYEMDETPERWQGCPLVVHDIRDECPRLSPEVIAAEGLVCHIVQSRSSS